MPRRNAWASASARWSSRSRVSGSRADVSKYFQEWFGPTGYMRRMEIRLVADKLTELSPDRNWGLVRGKALERYEAKDGELFDFDTRWTAGTGDA